MDGVTILNTYMAWTRSITALDDSVSYVELTDKYEIIKSDGRIVTMIEKEQNDGSDKEEGKNE